MRIDPIMPRPRRATLLAASTDFSGQVDWTHAAEGVEWESLAEATSGTWPRSTDGIVTKTSARRVNGTALANGRSLPFTIYGRDGADFYIGESDNYEAYARATLEAVTPDKVEEVFWTGLVRGAAYQTGITTLTSAQVLTGSGTNTIVPTLWALLDQIRLTSGIDGEVTFHAPEAMFAPVRALNILDRDDGPDGVVWRFGDNPFVFGAGYTNTGPGAVAATSGYGWLAVSGPVEYALRPDVRVLAQTSSRLDQHRVVAERDAFVRFDSAPVWCAQAEIGGW